MDDEEDKACGSRVKGRRTSGQAASDQTVGPGLDFLWPATVKLIADQVQGIIFLPNWQKSRGARLEAFVGLLQGKDFKFAVYGGSYGMDPVPQGVGARSDQHGDAMKRGGPHTGENSTWDIGSDFPQPAPTEKPSNPKANVGATKVPLHLVSGVVKAYPGDKAFHLQAAGREVPMAPGTGARPACLRPTYKSRPGAAHGPVLGRRVA